MKNPFKVNDLVENKSIVNGEIVQRVVKGVDGDFISYDVISTVQSPHFYWRKVKRAKGGKK